MANVKRVSAQVTPEEYLDGEKSAEIRGEFIDGFVYAMSGASEAHNDIVQNIVAWLRPRMPAGCRVFSQSMKLRVDTKSHENYYYPDVFVSCGPGDPKGYVRRDAILVVEVISPSTERIDRGEKFHAYTALPTLQEYVLVSQDGEHVEVFRRENEWKQEVHVGGSLIELASLEQSLPVDVIYADVAL